MKLNKKGLYEKLKHRLIYDQNEQKREAIKLLKSTWHNFRFNFKSVLFFEICYRLLTSFIFIPINYFIVNNFMKAEGIYSLSNGEFFSFACTVKGALCIFMLILIAFSVIFIEISVLTYIGYNSHKKNKVTLVEGVFNSFTVLPGAIGNGMFSLFFITAFVGPLIGIGLSSSLIKQLTIPAFITVELFKTNIGKILYGCFILLLILLFFRWVLAIPQIIIEKKRGRQCLRESSRIFRRNKMNIFIYMTMWLITSSIIIYVIKEIFIYLEWIVSHIVGSESFEFLVLGGIIFVLFYVAYIVISLIIMPGFIAFLIEIYYRLRDDNVKERDFSTHEDLEKNKIYITAKKYGRIYVRISLCIFIIFMGYRGFNVVFDKVIDKEVQVTAHRGAGVYAPENSISAIRAAIDMKADYAEIDVQTTKDNEVVLFHDNTLKRFSKDNRGIKDVNYDELLNIDIGSSFDSEYAGEKIPKLESVLKEAKGKIKLNIELKPMKKGDMIGELVVQLIKKYHMENEVVITSMNYDVIKHIEQKYPSLKTGYIIIAAIGNIESLQVDFLSVESSMIKPKFIYSMHSLGREVHAWTVNDLEEAAQLIKMGVDNIITDDVEIIDDAKNISRWKKIDHLGLYLESIMNVIKYGKI